MERKELGERTVAVIGGCGHVGLPLGVKLALSGAKVCLVDISADAVRTVNSGRFPFVERGGDLELRRALKLGLQATTEPAASNSADVVIFVTGTPVDEHLNPRLSGVLEIFNSYLEHFRDDALIVMRSTLFPGTMEHLRRRLAAEGRRLKLAFCPERVSQGFALEEIDSLPQIVSAFDEPSFKAAAQLFAAIAPSILRLEPIEAELTKLMANSWRYLEFAIANQFYMIAEKNGVDFYRIFDAIRYEYPRANGYKSPGFAAGPCLFKDTMQLASFFDNQFYLGHAAMLVNEGLAQLVVDKARAKLNGLLWDRKIGLLGLTFKANNDDIRESLSFKLKKYLQFEGAQVLAHDPFIPGGISLEELRERAELCILATPHDCYRELSFEQPLVDIWGFYPRPPLEISGGRTESANSA